MAALESNVFGPRLADDRNYPKLFDVEDAADLSNTLSTRISTTLLNTAGKVTKWGIGGACIGGGLFAGGAALIKVVKAVSFEERDEEDGVDIKQAGKAGALLGMIIGGGIAGCIQWYQTRDLQIKLETDFQTARENPDYSKKAREIFVLYLETIEANKEITCSITLDVFVYPVKATDGHTYEHQPLMDHLRQFANRLAKWKEHEKTRLALLQENPPQFMQARERPLSSPLGGKEIVVKDLELDVKMMKKVTEHVNKFFNLMRDASQKVFEEALSPKPIIDYILFAPTPPEGFKPPEIDNQDIVTKLVKKISLSKEEAFYIHDLYHHYASNMYTRNERIMGAITDSLRKQLAQGIITPLKYAQEQKALMKWYEEVSA